MVGGIGPVNDELLELLYSKDNSFENEPGSGKVPYVGESTTIKDSGYVPLRIKSSKFPIIKGFIKKILNK